MQGDVKVSINYEKLEEDARWDGLKGYVTNTIIPSEEVYAAYHNLWNVERAFRISKSKIEIRPMFHFTRRRIEAHVCICFVAYTVLLELERVLKAAGSGISLDRARFLAEKIYQIDYINPYDNKRKSVLQHTKEEPEVTELLDIISANC